MIAKAIQDQLVCTLREELNNCPDPLIYCADPPLEEINVSWGPSISDGLTVVTDRGTFEVRIAVTKVESQEKQE